MKRPLLLLLTSILIVLHTQAQTKGLLSLSLGPALPVGEFGSKGADDPESGLAKPGAVADLSYQHLFAKSNFGWIATLRYRRNAVDKKASVAPFQAEYPAFSWSMENCRWTNAAALLGAYYERPFTKQLSLSASLELGVAEAWSPKESITGKKDSAGVTQALIEANLHSVSATAFTALAAVGARYRCNSRWSVMAHIDYTYLQPTFHNVTAQIIQANGFVISGITSLNAAAMVESSAYTRNITQSMSSLDLVVGMCMDL